MDVGVLIPQGWKREYAGWDPARAWARTVELARQAEELGFESEWVFDHFTTVPEPTDEITFESFSSAVVNEQLSGILGIWRNLWEDSADLARHAKGFIESGMKSATEAHARSARVG